MANVSADVFAAASGIVSGGAATSAFRHLRWKVSMGGQDITSELNKYVISLETWDKDGTATDTARVSLNDKDSQFKFPPTGSRMTVDLVGTRVFEGIIDEIRSTAARGQGRLLTITAKGLDTIVGPSAKVPLDFHVDNTTLKDFMTQAATKSGITTMTVGPTLAGITRDYWGADNESFVHLGERMANEFGGTFKIRVDTAVLIDRANPTSLSASGAALPTIHGIWGDHGNLLRWDISPFVGRPRHVRARVNHYNRKKAKWEDQLVDIQDEQVTAETTIHGYSAHDADAATKKATGKKTKAIRESGEGMVVISLEPQARVEGTFILEKARPGVDGSYRIASVRHSIHRNSGSETELELKRPQPQADNRKAGTAQPAADNVAPYDSEQMRRELIENYYKEHPDERPPEPSPVGAQ